MGLDRPALDQVQGGPPGQAHLFVRSEQDNVGQSRLYGSISTCEAPGRQPFIRS